MIVVPGQGVRHVTLSGTTMSEETVNFPALNLLWPKKGEAGLEEAAIAASKLRTIKVLSADMFEVAAQDWDESGQQDVEDAVGELQLQLPYMEFTRRFLLSWNRAIHSYRDESLVIPKEAFDPEYKAKIHARNFLRQTLVAHHNIWRAIQGSPEPQLLLLAYNTYRFLNIGLPKPFPAEHRDWWVSHKDLQPGVVFGEG
ncbi:hypothetical protein BC629DRAFT_920373 [Irpex lacteus]|nr:hypothetical protein BC629DRAFT_920373 [Irpex lacteus]